MPTAQTEMNYDFIAFEATQNCFHFEPHNTKNQMASTRFAAKHVAFFLGTNHGRPRLYDFVIKHYQSVKLPKNMAFDAPWYGTVNSRN